MTKPIEVDEFTAAVLEEQAEAEGLSVAELVSKLAQSRRRTFSMPPDQKAELRRRWEAIEAGEPTIPHEEVAAWLKPWGTLRSSHGAEADAPVVSGSPCGSASFRDLPSR